MSLDKIPVDDTEFLARFVVASNWIRKGNEEWNIKPEAVMPHPNIELSVTRYRDLTEHEFWEIGEGVAAQRVRTFYGCIRFLAMIPRKQGLNIDPDEPPKNHAIVTKWPKGKPEQKALAQEIVANLRLIPYSKADNSSKNLSC
jgi:hypothetical protein